MKPVLLLVPGMLNTAEVWADVVARLPEEAAGTRVASVVGQDSIAGMAADAWQQLGDVAPQTPIVLAGFSLGGYVVMEMLARAPRTPHAVALISTQGGPETTEAAARRRKTIAAMEERFAGVVDGLVTFCTHEPGAALAARVREMMMGIGAAAATRQMHAIMQRADHRATLAQLESPTLVMCGGQDLVTPPERSQELARLLPRAELRLVQNAGHMLPLERPAEVADALQSLLASITTTEGDAR
jgi:pimeloyl-ACP methyl ester carboxylesterase